MREHARPLRHAGNRNRLSTYGILPVRRLPALVLVLLLASALATPSAQTAEYDLVVYGGTSAGVIAAVQAKQMGKSVVIVCPDKHLGGLSSGGLGFTDTGNKAVIGGLSREFYHRVWKHYDKPAAWKWQKQEEYGNKGQGTPAIDGEQRTMWIFEPHVAEQVFEDFVKEHEIPVHRDEWLDRAKGVKKDGARIASITTLERQDLRGQDVHRRDLRRRPDGGGGRRVPRRPRGERASTARSGTACRPACCTIGITSAC